jgi:hypothetical protein
MRRETLFTLGIGAIMGGLIGYVLSRPAAPAAAMPPMPAEEMAMTRWTSGYEGPCQGMYPEAGVAEMLYPYGEYHKMTAFSPSATLAGISGAAANGSIIYID